MVVQAAFYKILYVLKTNNLKKKLQYGWYWGPISGEAAEKILSNEPDGSFIVRDSSDDHYIFSLTFKLNSCVRHVRIEQDQGIYLDVCIVNICPQVLLYVYLRLTNLHR